MEPNTPAGSESPLINARGDRTAASGVPGLQIEVTNDSATGPFPTSLFGADTFQDFLGVGFNNYGDSPVFSASDFSTHHLREDFSGPSQGQGRPVASPTADVPYLADDKDTDAGQRNANSSTQTANGDGSSGEHPASRPLSTSAGPTAGHSQLPSHPIGQTSTPPQAPKVTQVAKSSSPNVGESSGDRPASRPLSTGVDSDSAAPPMPRSTSAGPTAGHPQLPSQPIRQTSTPPQAPKVTQVAKSSSPNVGESSGDRPASRPLSTGVDSDSVAPPMPRSTSAGPTAGHSHLSSRTARQSSTPSEGHNGSPRRPTTPAQPTLASRNYAPPAPPAGPRAVNATSGTPAVSPASSLAGQKSAAASATRPAGQRGGATSTPPGQLLTRARENDQPRATTPSLTINTTSRKRRQSAGKLASVPKGAERAGKRLKSDLPSDSSQNKLCHLCGSASDELLICSESACQVQVCVGYPTRECFTQIDANETAPTAWYCEHHQRSNLMNYRCNKELNRAMYKSYNPVPLLIIHVYGGPNIVPPSINWRLLEDFFPAAGEPLVMYFCFNMSAPEDSDTENSESRRGGRFGVEKFLTGHPEANVVVIINAHSSNEGLLTHSYPAPNKAEKPNGSWDLSPFNLLRSALGRNLEQVVGAKGVKMVIGLTCGQTFKVAESKQLWEGLMDAGFNHLMGFLDPLVAKNVAENIPTFLREFFLRRWSREGYATPLAFQAAIESTFVSAAMLSTHPLVYATGKSFYRYAPSIPMRSPWSLRTPDCGHCGAGSLVWTFKFYPKQNPSTVTYKCQHCQRSTTMKRPEKIESRNHSMWQVPWDSYVQWNTDAEHAVWHLNPPPDGPAHSGCQTLAEFAKRYLGNQSEFARRSFVAINPTLPLKRMEAMFELMSLAPQRWPEAARLFQLLAATPNDSMDTS